MVPGSLCFLRFEERVFGLGPAFHLSLPLPRPPTASHCLISVTATILRVSPPHHLPDSHRRGSCPWLPQGDWRSPPPGKPCVPARVPSGGPHRPPAQNRQSVPSRDSGNPAEWSSSQSLRAERAQCAGRGRGVFTLTLSNLCVKRQPCLAPQRGPGPSWLGELHL